MISEATTSASSDENNAAMEKSVKRKNNSGKVPRKIHKAKREKLKRDHLNVLFTELGKTLETSDMNNGKACTLNGAINVLRDLFAQVDCLKKENISLLSESHYVTDERNELKEEKYALQAEIEKLQNEIGQRVHSQPISETDNNISSLEDHLVQPPPVVIVPLHCTADSESNVIPSGVSKPHARYPSPSDSWPSQILAKQND